MVTVQWKIGDYTERAQSSIAEQSAFDEMTFTGKLTDATGTEKEVQVHVSFDPPLVPAKSSIEL